MQKDLTQAKISLKVVGELPFLTRPVQLFWILAPEIPESSHFWKSGDVQLWSNFLPDLADTSAVALC